MRSLTASRYSLLAGVFAFAIIGGGAYSLITNSNSSVNNSQAAGNCTVDEKLVNSCRPWLGAAAGGYSMAGSNDITNQINFFEKRLNNPNVLNNPSDPTTITNQIDFVHEYKKQGFTLSSTHLAFINRPDTYLQLNWKPTNGNWASAGGSNSTVNADIDKTANSIKSVSPKKIFLSVFHEPENDISSNPVSGCNVSGGGKGTPQEYVAMWQNVRNRFDALGVDNVVWSMNYMGFSKFDCVISQLWPGNDLVDWITYDPYVGGTDASIYRSSSAMTKKFYNFLTSSSDATHNYLSKPWGFNEFGYWNQNGTGGSTEEGAIQYWQEVKAALLAGEYPKIKLYSVFDTNSAVGSTVYSSSSLVGLEFNHNNTAVPNIAEQTSFNDFASTLLAMDDGGTTPPGPDTEFPTGSITAPSAGATVSGSQDIKVSASDNVGVTKVNFLIDGVFEKSDTSAPYEWTWDTRANSNAQHTILVKIYDAANNKTEKTINVTVNNDSEPPAVRGDINSDSKVDIVDLSILLSNWGSGDTGSDINGDDDVDIVDLSILLSEWST